jgi:hypothetical protein
MNKIRKVPKNLGSFRLSHSFPFFCHTAFTVETISSKKYCSFNLVVGRKILLDIMSD